MVDYVKFNWKPWDRYYIDQAEAEQLLKRVNEAEQRNREIHAEKLQQHQQMVSLAIAVYGPRSRQAAYLRREAVPTPPSHRAVRQAILRDLEAGKAAIVRREKNARTKAKRELCIDALIANGYVLDRDFRKSNAISFAKRNLHVVDGRLVRREPIVFLLPERVG